MKNARKVGQLVIAGFDGTSPDRRIGKMIKQHSLGGVVLFSRNLESPKQAARLTNSLQKMSSAPLFIAIDHEGGKVSRLPAPFTKIPSARTVGLSDSAQLAYACGEMMARELKAVGINLNFAPVLDVDTNPQNPVIGERSLGKSSVLVSKIGLAVIAGLQDNHVVACGKHFPGHGDTSVDSHKALPKITHGIDRLLDVELKPFIHAIENRLAAVMTAHVLYTALDQNECATFSKNILARLLRKKIGFAGPVITDDISMGAVSQKRSPGKAAVDAINAGADLILACKREAAEEAVDALAEAMEKGTIRPEQVDAALDRILRVKGQFLLPYHPVDPNEVGIIVGSFGHLDLSRRIAALAEKRSRFAATHA